MATTPRNQIASATAAGQVTTGAQVLAGAKTFSSAPVLAVGAAMGTGNTAVMCKALSGTTSGTQGGVTSIPHGLADTTKIFSITGLVNYSTNYAVMACHQADAGYQFNLQYDASNVVVHLVSGNSGSILSAIVRVVVWYTA